MMYALIDNDGELNIKHGAWRTEVGPEGPGRVRLQPDPDGHEWAGWVNDDGHRLGLPRNIVGGLILNALGAPPSPYPGPVVITGWGPLPHTEVRGLSAFEADAVREIHDHARRALAGEAASWADDARAIAEYMRTTPTPGLTVLAGADALARLRGRL
ncbi:hypothetical protein DP939_02205 [Spongiactinospora rosea]|uniref:Uncharacterized protein n=1 Tax=Spongiactinospora rosea TaxID=2248750 RepID=A0A366M6U5_9ACTN|nr:hypothetical protein [Spongiactinospora rosea]RBQ21543.1 hypothetical protein DP939_02205 [Spongiactinospora rosea]